MSGPGLPRRALLLALVALAALVARAAVSPGLRPPDPAPPPLRAGEEALALLGPFKALVANVLFVELDDAYDRGDYAAVLPLADTITALHPEHERVFAFAAWTLAVQIPGFEEGLPADELWAWRKAGLMKLREGTARNPESWFLRFEEGWLACRSIAGRPGLEARFLADRDVNPEGLTATEYATRRFREAAAAPGPHPAYVDRYAAVGCAPP